MKRFPVARLLFNLVIIISSIFLVISSYQQFHGFLRVSAIKVTNEKEINYPVCQSIAGEAFFISYPVESPSAGVVEKLVENYTFVNKDELICRIKSNGHTYDVFAPDSGLLLWGTFNKYFSSLDKIISFKKDIEFSNTPNRIGENSTLCSILNNDFTFVRMKNSEALKSSAINVYVNGNPVSAKKVLSSNEYAFFKISELVKYFINKNEFSVFEGFKRGVVLNKGVLVSNGKEQGVFIVRHNVIKFVTVKTYNLNENEVVAVPDDGNLDSLIVILTPHLVKDGEVFNE